MIGRLTPQHPLLEAFWNSFGGRCGLFNPLTSAELRCDTFSALFYLLALWQPDVAVIAIPYCDFIVETKFDNNKRSFEKGGEK